MSSTVRLPSWLEEGPRAALLLWGGGMLAAGLALVGAGAGDEGAPLALAGLFNTIYGIHVFGRLGPDDGAPTDADAGQRAYVRWTGAFTALGGLVVVFDHKGGVGPWAYTAYGLTVLGAIRFARAARMAPKEAAGEAAPVAKGPAAKGKVEKKRRMDKSPAP